MDDFSVIDDIDDNYLDTQVNTPKYNSFMDISLNYDTLKKQNISKPIMSKYEKTKIIGIRAEEIARGAQPLIEVPPGITKAEKIAEEELKQRKTPFILRRLINNKYEYWRIEDLEFTQ